MNSEALHCFPDRSRREIEESIELTVGITGALRCAIFLTSLGRYTCLRLIHTTHELERRLVFSSLVTRVCTAQDRTFMSFLQRQESIFIDWRFSSQLKQIISIILIPAVFEWPQ